MQSERADTEQDQQFQTEAEAPRFVQFLFFRIDPAWRRLAEEERTRGKRELSQTVEHASHIKTFAYSTLGLKADADLMLWRIAGSLDDLQETLSALLMTGLGKYLSVTYSLFGMTRPSQYT